MPPTPAALAAPPLDHDAAYAQIAAAAHVPCRTSRVGLELELHLIDLDEPTRRPSWDQISDAVLPGPLLPGLSRLTIEPGGQLELSAPPADDLASAIGRVRTDERALRAHCRERGLGLLAWGADPLRPPGRVHPGERYVAMEQHYAGRGHGEAGARMMTATASLQVNLDLGEGHAGAQRWRALAALAPVLTAVSACSPQLAGERSGWASMRQQAWEGLDRRRAGAVSAAIDLADAWAAYALAAPVMMVADHEGGASAVCEDVPFERWLGEPDLLGRAPTAADLAHHLTTLFPPLRPRGFVEVRCLDAADARWWPGLVALTTAVLDESAAEQITRACAGLPDVQHAARDGLRHARLRRAASAVIDIAASQPGCPDAAQRSLEALQAEAYAGRSPGDQVQARLDEAGAVHAVREAIDCEEDIHA